MSSWRATAYAPPPLGNARQTWRYEIATTASITAIAAATWRLSEERRRAADDEHAQDLLGRVGGGRDRVGAEDRQGEALRQALAGLLLVGQRTADRATTWRAAARPSGVRGTLAAGFATSWLTPV